MSVRVIRTRFDPRQIASLTGWFDALDSAGYTSVNDQISEWLDKSGGGRHLAQTTANNRPTLFESTFDLQNTTRAIVNGRQALFFDRNNDRLTSTATFTTSHARTIFAVVRTSGATDNQPAWSLGALSGSAVRLVSYEGGATSGSKLVAGDAFAINASTTATRDSTVAHISCHSQSSARVLRYFLDGTSIAIAVGATLSTQTDFAGLEVGRLSVNNSFFGGHYGELLIYDRELSAAERDAITRYLGGRWGIAVS